MTTIATTGRLKVLTGLVVVAAAAATPSVGAAKPPTIKPAQELATVLTTHHVYAAPGTRRSGVRVRSWRPITGTQTVLPVTGHATTADGVGWLRVMLPGRPNGARGWIAQRDTVPSTTSWHIVVRTATRQVRIYRAGRFVRSYKAIVGTPSTPTPHGQAFVEESVLMPRGSHGGPYALALSARSNVLQTFGGGPGQIALHGVANLGGTLGTAVSHGCIRLSNRNITWLAARIAPGVPVSITS